MSFGGEIGNDGVSSTPEHVQAQCKSENVGIRAELYEQRRHSCPHDWGMGSSNTDGRAVL